MKIRVRALTHATATASLISGLALATLPLIPTAALPSAAIEAQEASSPMRGGKKVLTIDEYALWRSIGDASISPDGQWVTYSLRYRDTDEDNPVDPDRPLTIKSLQGGDSILVVRAAGPEFSDDSRWIAYFVDPEPGKGGDDSSNQRAVELRNLESGETQRWENARSFSFADAGAALLVKKGQSDEDAEYDGSDLIVRYLASGAEDLVAYVDEFDADQPGGRVAYTVDAPDGESNGVHVLDLTTRIRTPLDAERGAAYARLTWGGDPDAEVEPAVDALAVLKGRDMDEWVERENALLMWPAVSEATEPIVLDPRPEEEDEADTGEEDQGEGESSDDPRSSDGTDASGDGFPPDRVISEKSGLRWAPDASRLFVGTRPQLPAPSEVCEADGDGEDDEEAETSSDGPKLASMATRTASDGRPLGPEEVSGSACPEFVADVDIWHIGDERIQSVQILSANRDRNRTHMGVVHLEGSGSTATPRYVQLADETMESLSVSEDGHSSVGMDDRAYRSDWRPNYRDYYHVDVNTGERTLILEKHLRQITLHNDVFLYWKDRHIWSYDLESGDHTNLTANAPVTFENEEFDRGGEKPPHGIAGWTTDGDMIVQHRYDLYRISLDGDEIENLTQGVGEENEIRFRIFDTDPLEAEIDLDEPLYLSSYGQWTKKAGFYRLDGDDLEELVSADARLGSPTKAKHADVVMFTKQDFETFPDYHVASLDFENPVQVTDANPQQEEYNWGRRILFDYETHDGVRLQGTLAIPYDYREGERRPLLVNFYEKHSQNLHSYPTPRHAGSPNFAGYVSAGYMVMQPDIHFRMGPSHSQMLEAINLALDEVVEMGYVDPDRIGLHGHSYSGQGATYISTHSDRFAAIVAGAAATNLVSDFNQLWKSAGTNQHRYDIMGQGRFGTSPYDDFEMYVDQSAVHNAENMNTPLLLLHGTDDGSVEWLQAVEFYNGLRWHGKEVILLSYPGAGHGLRKYENQKDFQIRTRQFFDHHLRDVPMPSWMDGGRTFIQKERDLGMLKKSGGR